MEAQVYSSEIYKLSKFIRTMPNSYEVIKTQEVPLGTENEDILYHIIDDLYNKHLINVLYTKFIDFCSAPGVYSRYLLDKKPQAKGVGITLPQCEGGVTIEELVKKKYKKRYEVHYSNIYKVDFVKYRPRYDLCVASCISYDKDADDLSEYKIIFKSLLLCLQILEKGGCLVINFTFKDLLLAINFIHMVGLLFDSVELFKSTKTWVLQRTFYVVAKGYTHNDALYKKYHGYYDNLKSSVFKLKNNLVDIRQHELSDIIHKLEMDVFIPQIKAFVALSTKV